MNRPDLLKKIESILDAMERERAWGTVEVEVRDGTPNMIRHARNEKLIAQETNRAEHRQKY
jgi:hypothetical protein